MLDDDNARAVAEVCPRLDGIPLAIELAAARARLLRPAALLRRLDRSLNLLASRPRPARQGEQVLFRRLAVFASSRTLESAQAVCANDVMPAAEVLNQLENLVDNSLVRHIDDAYDEPRSGMLETVREYAQEWLEASGEADLLRGRHQAWCLAMAEQRMPERTATERAVAEARGALGEAAWSAANAADHALPLDQRSCTR